MSFVWKYLGKYGIGLATRKVSLNNIPLGNDADSWVLRTDGGIYSNGIKKFQISQTIDEGDIIGVTYDHEILNFYINGDDMECAITGIMGTVYPAFFGKLIKLEISIRLSHDVSLLFS